MKTASDLGEAFSLNGLHYETFAEAFNQFRNSGTRLWKVVKPDKNTRDKERSYYLPKLNFYFMVLVIH